MSAHEYDVIVVGGGPAGAVCSLYAARAGVRVLLLDKAVFPRDKVCGDAVSGISLRFLQELGLQEAIEEAACQRGRSMRIFAPDGTEAEISFTPQGRDREHFNIICRREVLDSILFHRAKEEVETLEGFSVRGVVREKGIVCGVTGVHADGREETFRAKVTVGADGSRSMVAGSCGLRQYDPQRQVIATRAYYTGVSDMRDAIEIHFIHELIPGYFWIFPLKDNQVNVGVGMLQSEVMRRKINIHQAHMAATGSKRLAERFAGASMLGQIQGWTLPLAHRKRRMVDDGVLLVGDAAGLVHPLSGEGISFSMLSGYHAAKLLAEVCPGNNFTREVLLRYQDRLWKEVGREFFGGTILQKVGSWKPFINKIVGKANRNSEFNNMISQLLAGDLGAGALINPLVYLRMMFR